MFLYFSSFFILFFVWLVYIVLLRRAIHNNRVNMICSLIALILLATYLINMEISGQTVYGGLVGDNSFQVALLNNVIHGNYFGDYYSKSFPLDYPPLFFWLVGTVARWLHLDAITAWRLYPIVLLPALPFIFFQIGKKIGDRETALWTCITALGIGGINFNTGFFGVTQRYAAWGIVSLALAKPHEMLTVLVLMYWMLDINLRKFDTEKMSLFRTFLVGGLISLMYYPFLVPGLLTLVLECYRQKSRAIRINLLNHIIFLILGSLIIGAPFLGRIVYYLSRLPHGPNYRIHYIELGHFDPIGYTLGLGYGGGLFIFGLLAIRRLWRQSIKSPGYILIITYALVGINFFTYSLLRISWLPAKWIEFLMVFFAGLAGKGLKEFVYERLSSRKHLIMLLISASLIPNPVVWNLLYDYNFYPDNLVSIGYQIVAETEKTLETKEPVVLATPPVAFVLPAISEWSLYLSPNIHYAGIFSNFALNQKKVISLKYSAEVERALKEMGVQVIVLRKEGSGYKLYVHLRSRPTQIWSSDPWPYPYESIFFSPSVFSSPGFIKTFENEEYICFVIRNTLP